MATNKYTRPQAFARLIIWIQNASGKYRSEDLAASPTTTAGEGAPTTTEPDGSIWLRNDGGLLTTIYVRVASAWIAFGGAALANDIADPGDAGAIPVTASGSVSIVTAGAETRTLADPPAGAIGRQIALSLDTDAGDCVLTAASPVNQAANNTLTLDAVGETVVLTAIEIAGAPKWRITANDGVGLTTV